MKLILSIHIRVYTNTNTNTLIHVKYYAHHIEHNISTNSYWLGENIVWIKARAHTHTFRTLSKKKRKKSINLNILCVSKTLSIKKTHPIIKKKKKKKKINIYSQTNKCICTRLSNHSTLFKLGLYLVWLDTYSIYCCVCVWLSVCLPLAGTKYPHNTHTYSYIFITEMKKKITVNIIIKKNESDAKS